MNDDDLGFFSGWRGLDVTRIVIDEIAPPGPETLFLTDWEARAVRHLLDGMCGHVFMHNGRWVLCTGANSHIHGSAHRAFALPPPNAIANWLVWLDHQSQRVEGFREILDRAIERAHLAQHPLEESLITWRNDELIDKAFLS